MTTAHKRIELFANIAIILVAISLAVVLVKRFVFTGPTRNPPSDVQETKAGTKLSLPNLDWSQNSKTLVLVVSNRCHFCTESAPFYQRLVQERAQRGSFGLIAVLPQPVSDGHKYMDTLGVSIDDVRQGSLGSIGVKGTPTLLLVNNTGVVTDVWFGKLPPEKQAEVLSRLL